MPKLIRIISYGKSSFVEVDGKTYGMGVNSIIFKHRGGCEAELVLDTDPQYFAAMRDGKFHEAEKIFLDHWKKSRTQDECGIGVSL